MSPLRIDDWCSCGHLQDLHAERIYACTDEGCGCARFDAVGVDEAPTGVPVPAALAVPTPKPAPQRKAWIVPPPTPVRALIWRRKKKR